MVIARNGARDQRLLCLFVSFVIILLAFGSAEAFLVVNHVDQKSWSLPVGSMRGVFGISSLSSSTTSRIPKRITTATTSIIKTRTTLAYNNDGSTTSMATTNTTNKSVPLEQHSLLDPPVPSIRTSKIFSPSQHIDLLLDGTSYQIQEERKRKRQELKEALSIAAIEEYDMDAYNAGMTTIAEEYMKCLEEICPWPTPAYHPQLNARWSFVFTGVPTIGMKLITLLSRISVGIPMLEFDNVFLEVSKNQSQVKAIVKVQLWGNPIELNVYTLLSPPHHNNNNNTNARGDNIHDIEDNDHGTLLIETFDKLVFMGHEVPTPASWKSSRKLHITYLDDDMMIARTNGGEPHLLLRHSPCGTDDDSCDLDTEDPTPFFQEAINKYGRHLSRSLVDRAYTIHSETKGTLDMANIVRLIHGIMKAPNGH